MNSEVIMAVKSLLAPQIYGLNISELRRDYQDLLGSDLDYVSDRELQQQLASVPGITVKTDHNEVVFRYYSLRTNHLFKMNKASRHQRRPKSIISYPKFSKRTAPVNIPPPASNPTHPINRQHDCFFKNNRGYLNKKYRNQRWRGAAAKPEMSGNSYLNQFELIGDDFLLSLKKFELGSDFEKGNRIRTSGLCISGQTINSATKKLSHHPLPGNKNVIINLGSVDILHGHTLLQIVTDFRMLLSKLYDLGIHDPIVTTLAPLANKMHNQQIKQKVLDVNRFLIQHCSNVIDLYGVMVDESDGILFSCYQPSPRNVSGSTEPHVFWNKIGRQRVLKRIQSTIEEFFLRNFNIFSA